MVDDMPQTIGPLCRELEGRRMGVDVRGMTSTGERIEGLRIAEAVTPELVLLDITATTARRVLIVRMW